MNHLRTGYWKEVSIPDIIRLSDDIEEAFPDHHVVSIGETLAWSVMALGLSRALNGKEPATSHVAFSGRFMAVRNDHFETIPTKLPDQDSISHYFNHLVACDASPAQIQQRYQETGQKTLFTDFACSGSGLASFLYLYHLIAREKNGLHIGDVQKSTEFYIVENDPNLEHAVHIKDEEDDKEYTHPIMARSYNTLLATKYQQFFVWPKIWTRNIKGNILSQLGNLLHGQYMR